MISDPPAALSSRAERFAIVIAPNEFWLHLHRLAEAYDAEGLSTEERTANIVSQFLEMPVIAQRHILSDLVAVSMHIPELYPLINTAIHKVEMERRQTKRERAG